MNSNGYARVLISGRKQYIHRVSYEAYKGSIAPGLVVRHSCDTPCCVNPDHLSVGTHVDNAMDMVSRGRSMKGRQAGPNWRRKLTADQVYEAMASRESDAATGRRFGVAKGVIRHLRIGKTYRELTRSAA